MLTLLSVPSYNLVLALHSCQPTTDDSGGDVLSQSFLPKLEERKSLVCLERWQAGLAGAVCRLELLTIFFLGLFAAATCLKLGNNDFSLPSHKLLIPSCRLPLYSCSLMWLVRVVSNPPLFLFFSTSLVLNSCHAVVNAAQSMKKRTNGYSGQNVQKKIRWRYTHGLSGILFLAFLMSFVFLLVGLGASE